MQNAALSARSSTMAAHVRVGGSQTRHVAACRQQRARRGLHVQCAAGETTQQQLALPRAGHMLISKTEVPSFIQRDDMMDQLYRWALIEAGEGGLRNFGMPMKVAPLYNKETLWGFDLQLLKEGVNKADLGVNFDGEIALKHEWVGRDKEGFPQMEGNAEEVMGKHIEVWKVDPVKVDEDTRTTIRTFCTGLVSAMNRYYAFGSVWAEEV
ncbi:MAG: hypothetical protein J3K34DRAFT_438416 [Monoraphidium minutum]|nr:MAG: hypothetical protein J3K34DRAFT_438416 [Monoraphidium minutum]